ncbi:DUF2252 domain-containing protein [Guptibacillus hwajinpoensis]|uniref:DUF2252 domain-containing protein n=1 Tax=Guptibacillus hwajinpoensis TaxID=208199 RepID=UPI0024B3B940|nr:DUF2252 family protein [Pseudalkalibacillus hwajinpoensis]
MSSISTEHIKNTRSYLRKQTLQMIIEQFDSTLMKLTKAERNTKYQKMSESPFSFFRGSAYLYYYDVTQIPFHYHTPGDKPTWLMGDLHFDNFSAFRNEDGENVFDVDDFDEGYLGSYLYDLLRMAVSIRLYAEDLGYSEENQDNLVSVYIENYVNQLQQFEEANENPVELQFTQQNTEGPIKDTLAELESHSPTDALEKQTFINNEGNRQFIRKKDKVNELEDSEKNLIKTAWSSYTTTLKDEVDNNLRHYEIKDMVEIVGAGVGSTGLKRYLILVQGVNTEDHMTDLILEAKEARTPIPAYFFPYDQAFWDTNKHEGLRVIKTQKAMHHKQDPHLGYITINDKEFYVREKSPYSAEIEPDHIQNYPEFKQTVTTMAKISAKIHARADSDIDHHYLTYHSETEILNVIDTWENLRNEVNHWASFYQNRVKQDFTIFKEWLKEKNE